MDTPVHPLLHVSHLDYVCFRLFLRSAATCVNSFATAHFQYDGSAYNRKAFGTSYRKSSPSCNPNYKGFSARISFIYPRSNMLKHLPFGSDKILNRILSVAAGCTLAGDIDVTYGKPRLLHEKTWHINFALLWDYATLGKKTNCTACQFCPWITRNNRRTAHFYEFPRGSWTAYFENADSITVSNEKETSDFNLFNKNEVMCKLLDKLNCRQVFHVHLQHLFWNTPNI